MQRVIALFGEAEKGCLDRPYVISQLPQLLDLLGHPPPESQGLFFAVQSLLYEREVVFFRVQEEGYSLPDYLRGLSLLKDKKQFQKIHALCMPGVGDVELLDATQKVCFARKACFLVTEKDFYDYLTH
jgi:hypothetical protein